MEKKNKSLTINFIMNACLSMSSVIFPLITFPYVSRILLPEGNGRVATATSVIAYFNLFAQLGIPSYGIRLCARVRDDREALTRTVHELFGINLAMSFIAYVGLAFAIAFIPKIRDEKALYVLVSTTIFLSAIGIEWMYRGLEQYTYITVRSICFKLIGLIAMFLLIHRKEDYVIYGGITVLSSSVSYILNFINARCYIDIKRPPACNWKRHMKPIAVFFAMACATTVYTHLDVVMLGFMKTDTDVGYYHAAVRIKSLLVSVVTSLGAVLLPRSAYYVEQGMMEEFRRISEKALHFIFWAAVPLVVFFILFAEPCIYLISGTAYQGSIVPMQLIMPTLLLIGLTNILGMQILVPLGREKIVLYSEIAGAIVDLVLNALLIGRLASAGAAIGTLAAEAVVFIFQYCSLRNEVRGAFLQIPYKKLLASVFAGAAVAWNIKNIGWYMQWEELGYFLLLLISVALFGGLYILLLMIMHEPFTEEVIDKCLNFGKKIIYRNNEM